VSLGATHPGFPPILSLLSFGMSQSPRANAVRAFVEKAGGLDFDGAYDLVTDDFLLQFEPKQMLVSFGLDYTGGGVKYQEFFGKIANNFSRFKTTTDSLTETGDTVILKARTQFSYVALATAVSDEAPYTATFTFSGNKIKSIKFNPDLAYVAKYTK